MNELNSTFMDKVVLVTGHTGFKGSWLIAWLHHLGAQVIGLALDPHTLPSHFVELELAVSFTCRYPQNINHYSKILQLSSQESRILY